MSVPKSLQNMRIIRGVSELAMDLGMLTVATGDVNRILRTRNCLKSNKYAW